MKIELTTDGEELFKDEYTLLVTGEKHEVLDALAYLAEHI